VESFHNGEKDRILIKSSHLLWALLIMSSLVAGGMSLLVPPLIVIGGIMVLLSVVVIFKYSFVGLIMYLAIFLIRPAEMWPVLEPLHVERAVGILALLSTLIRQKALYGRLFFPTDVGTRSLLLFLALMCVSWVISYDRVETGIMVENFFKLIIVYIIVLYEVDTQDRFDIFLGSFVLLIGFIAFLAFRDYYGGGSIYRMGIQRAIGRTSAGGDANTMATTMATTIPLAIVFIRLYKNIIIRIVAFGLIGLLLLMIVNTGSRTGMVTLIAVSGTLIFFSRHRMAAIALVVVIIGIGWVFLPDQYRDRYMTIVDDEEDLDKMSSGRIEIWENGIQMFLSSPFYGVGGSFKAANASGDFGPALKMQAHNLYIQILACYGIIGFAVWMTFLLSMIVQLLRSRPPDTYVDEDQDRELAEENKWFDLIRQSILAVIAGLLISGIFSHSLNRYTWYFMGAMTVACVNIYYRHTSLMLPEKKNEDIEVATE